MDEGERMPRQRFIDFGAHATVVQEAGRKILIISTCKLVFTFCLSGVLLFGLVGCSSHSPEAATSDPVAKVRLTRINKFYRLYSNQKKKPPPDEKSFKDFVRSLPQDEKDAALIRGDDVDSLFVSPRDGQKYHIEYGLVARPEGPNRALAWEETGQKGMRYVALTMGYVKECDEEEFQKQAKKK
jgi:hypothetical protein